jgi:hypothetical protein
MQGSPTFLTGPTGLALLATATQAEAQSVIGVSGSSNLFALLRATGNPLVIQRSVNISSIDTLGTGIYDIYFATQPPDANYVVALGNTLVDIGGQLFFSGVDQGSFTTQKFRILCLNASRLPFNDSLSVAVFR